MFYMICFPSLLVNLAISFAVAFIAGHKGRNPLGWFILSFFAGLLFNANLLLLIILLITRNVHEERARVVQSTAWKRRHHESLEEERFVNRRFRQHVIRRLDRQDDALGLPPVPEAFIEEHGTALKREPPPRLGCGEWYFVIDGKEKGPIPEEKAVEMLKQGEIDGRTYAWSEGMRDWQRVGSIGNFSAYC